MKEFLLTIIAICCFASCKVEKSSSVEDWYSTIKFADGFKDEVTLHISTTDSGKFVTIDFPLKNIGCVWGHEPFFEVEADCTAFSNGEVSILVSNLELDFIGKINKGQTEMSGQLYLSGKPYDVLFTKSKSSVPKNPEKIDLIPGLSISAGSPDKEMKRVIEKSSSLFTEELTWMEIRDALKDGKTTIIIPTGGVEQNGQYLVTGKHNYVLRGVADSIASKLGNALIAPIVPFVPEGEHNPATSHMKYPGTISLQESTYELLLKDIARSYKAHGFKNIIFFGDSGGNQWGMYLVSKELSAEWKNDNCRVLYIHDYYDNYRVAQWLNSQGVKEVDAGAHDNFQYTSQMVALNPNLVRKDKRIATGNFSINGVNLEPTEKTIELGRKLCNYQAEITVQAIKRAIENKKN